MTYGEWVKRFGIDAEGGYKRSVGDAKLERELGRAGYGTDAESLSILGLSNSGYRDFVTMNNEKSYDESVSKAASVRDSAEEQNSNDYAKYSDSYDKTEGKLLDSVIKNITNGYVTDYEKILEYANSTGLTADKAELAAKSGYDAVIQRLRESVIEGITSYKYGEKYAYRYALEIGLPEDIAKKLADYARMLNEKRISESNHLTQIK